MRVTLWGTRGSLATPGPDTARYGGNTSCVEVCGNDGSVLVLDAGTGIRRLGNALSPALQRIDVLLTHLHMDHIQGLGFFAPLYRPDIEVHIWGPASTTLTLRARLTRYLSPPFFPVHLRDLACRLELHEVPCGEVAVGPFRVRSDLVCHPGPTVGYRISTGNGVLVYMPDHEPALGVRQFPAAAQWTSGCDLAADADLLIHDAQYTAAEYAAHIGWGHSSIDQTLQFAALARAKHLVPFHHDPTHRDADIDRMMTRARSVKGAPRVTPGMEGATFQIARETNVVHTLAAQC